MRELLRDGLGCVYEALSAAAPGEWDTAVEGALGLAIGILFIGGGAVLAVAPRTPHSVAGLALIPGVYGIWFVARAVLCLLAAKRGIGPMLVLLVLFALFGTTWLIQRGVPRTPRPRPPKGPGRP